MLLAMSQIPRNDAKTVAEAARQVAPFALAGVAAPLVAIGSDVIVDNWALTLGVALLIVSSVCMVIDLANSPHRLWQDVCVFASLAALSLLVHGAGGIDSGAALVLLVPLARLSRGPLPSPASPPRYLCE